MIKTKKILILGIDGFLGWTLALHLTNKGYHVAGVDNGLRRRLARELDVSSLIPIKDLTDRANHLGIDVRHVDISEEGVPKDLLEWQPNAIIHLAEQPSAPVSMVSKEYAALTQKNNIVGTLKLIWDIAEYCPDTHLVKLGTMGEYSDWIYEKVKIPESNRIKVKYQNKEIEIPTPHYTGSWYHWSKIHDSNNIDWACNLWGLRATDVQQGVVYGTHIDAMKEDWQRTRFDYGSRLGTAINRFVLQAIADYPLTVYGKGGQTRGFLPLRDSMQCLNLIIDNPPKEGEFRVINQIENTYSVNELAKTVKKVAKKFDIDVTIDHIKNPRVEKERHQYKVEHKKLLEMGYKPTTDMEAELAKMFEMLIPLKDRINKKIIKPRTTWQKN